jgi:hypothetical protein
MDGTMPFLAGKSMIRSILTILPIAFLIAGCASRYASRGSCGASTHGLGTSGEIVQIVAPVTARFGLAPAGDVPTNEGVFSQFQVGEKKSFPRERIAVLVATRAVYVAVTDFNHDRRTALVGELEDAITERVQEQYPCFKFKRMTDF